MVQKRKGFIQQTANDYDMNYDDVEHIYESGGDFYGKLEEFIKNRANNN